jgi:glycosyltransferase involved in cell wall biosynthesis
MRILMLSPKLYPHIGGVEKHVLRVSEELTKQGHEIVVITAKEKQEDLEFEKFHDITILRIQNSRIQMWLYLLKNRYLINQSDIIHCHDYSTFYYWFMPFRFIYRKKPVFITFHGYEGKIPIPYKVKIIRLITEKLTRGNICIGDFIPKWYGTNPSIVLYGGVDIPDHPDNAASRSEPELNSAVFIGRLEKDTGILEYISALDILKDHYHCEFSGHICGDGSFRELIEKTLIEQNIKFEVLGFIEKPEVYYEQCRFAFVSGYLGILEAMAHRRMIFNIASDPLKEDYLRLIPNAEQMMVTTNSAEELAEKIFHYYKNPEEIRPFEDNAYEFAKKRSWKSVADEYLRLWGSENSIS